MKKCRICGKEFDVLWPELWRYKRVEPPHGEKFFCSWKCLREYDTAKEAKKEKGVKEAMEERKERTGKEEMLKRVLAAVEEGHEPIEYLRSLGYKQAAETYRTLRMWAREHNPGAWKQLPTPRRGKREKKEEEGHVKGAEEQVERRPAVTAEDTEEIRRQLRDQEKRFKDEKWRKPLEAASLKSRVLKADYSFNSEDRQMVIRGPGLAMNMIVMTAEEWRHLSAEILVALKQLGMGDE